LEQLSDYLDDGARQELCRAIEAHLKDCSDCQVYVDGIRKTIVLYKADAQVELPGSVSSKLQSVMASEYKRRAEGGVTD
jgi:predicted anti-sigma-YlaC factor YlaD